MNDPPSKRSSDAGESAPAEPSSETDPFDRPTLNPPFDVEAFARAASAPSLPPDANADAPTDRPPLPPPVPKFEPERGSQRVTLTNEAELELARAQSALVNPPPRRLASGALSIANARAPSISPLRSEPAPGAAATPAPWAGNGGGRSTEKSSQPPEITETTIDDPAAEMRARLSLGDYTGALEISELILADAPDDVEAVECGAQCRRVLEDMYSASLGPLDRVPTIAVPRAQMQWLSMDHRAGFVLSLVDGQSTLEMILDVCGMPKLDAYRILHELVERRVVSLR